MKQISYQQVLHNLKLKDLYSAMKDAYIAYNSPELIGIPVNLLHFADKADTHIKIAAISTYDYFSIKVVSMFPQNCKKGLSPHSGAIFLFDTKTGFPYAMIDDRGLITDLRTAASGAMITHFLTQPDAKTMSILGTGNQAYYQGVAFSQLRDLDCLIIYGRDIAKANDLKERFRKAQLQLEIKTTDVVQEAVQNSAIIISTCSSLEPIIKGQWLEKGQHITAIGSDDAYKREIDHECFERADHIYLDSLSLNKQYGEYSHSIKKNPFLIHKTQEFGHVLQQEKIHDSIPKITIAKLVGIGVQDLAAATVLLDKLK